MRVRHILPILEHSNYFEMAIKEYEGRIWISMMNLPIARKKRKYKKENLRIASKKRNLGAKRCIFLEKERKRKDNLGEKTFLRKYNYNYVKASYDIF